MLYNSRESEKERETRKKNTRWLLDNMDQIENMKFHRFVNCDEIEIRFHLKGGKKIDILSLRGPVFDTKEDIEYTLKKWVRLNEYY